MRMGLLFAGTMLIAGGGCPKDRTKVKPAGGDATAATPIDAAPAEVPFTAAPTPIVARDIVAATFDWNRPTLTEKQLEDALDDGDPDDVAQVRAKGRIVVTVADAWVQPFDAKTGKTPYRGAGLLGLDIDPPVVFTADPILIRGEMPMGGSVRLHTGYVLGTIDLDAAARDAIDPELQADPLVTQVLVELGDLGLVTDESGEQVTVLRATLHGVRVVQLGARRTWLEGKPGERASP